MSKSRILIYILYLISFSLNCLISNSKHENLALFEKKKKQYYQRLLLKQLKLQEVVLQKI